MARGDVYNGKSEEVADDGEVEIRPAAGRECMVYSIMWSGAGTDIPALELYWDDSADSAVIATESQFPELVLNKGILDLRKFGITVTNSIYLTVKNVSGAAMDVIGWTGVEWHVAD